MRSRLRSDDGVVLVIGALLMTTLLVAAAFAVDLGNARQFKRQAQATADAAALAGAGSLDGTDSAERRGAAVAQVKLYAQRNFDVDPAAWNGCGDLVPAGWLAPDAGNDNRCILVDDANLRVRITELPRRPVATWFGRLAGVDEIEITASAAAITQVGVAGPCGLCVLGPFNAQNGDITVSGDAGVSINGNANTQNNGSLTVTTPGQDIRVYDGGTVSGNFSPSPLLTPGTLPDPLAGIPVPTATGSVKSGCGQGPGIYSSIPTNCALAPGLYVVTGGTHISGHTTIDATAGVTLYLTCGNGGAPQPCTSSGQVGAQLVCTGQSTANVVAQPTDQPAVGGAIPGMAIFFDRNNTGGFDCRGNGGSGVVGTIYGARSTLRMRGNGECTFNDSLVVVRSVSFSGNPSNCTVHYNTSDNVRLQSMSALIE